MSLLSRCPDCLARICVSATALTITRDGVTLTCDCGGVVPVGQSAGQQVAWTVNGAQHHS
jgi:hypothetical protein